MGLSRFRNVTDTLCSDQRGMNWPLFVAMHVGFRSKSDRCCASYMRGEIAGRPPYIGMKSVG
jgi:hypothetical protein